VDVSILIELHRSFFLGVWCSSGLVVAVIVPYYMVQFEVWIVRNMLNCER